MFNSTKIKYVAIASLVLLLLVAQLTDVGAALIQLRNDNETAAGYHSSWKSGDIVGAVLTPNAGWTYPVRVESVQFLLHRFAGATSNAGVRVRVYSVAGGVPGALLGSSSLTTITTLYPNWASVDLSSANIILSSPDPFMVAIEYVTGTSGSIPSTLTDSQQNIATGKNFYSLDGGLTWHEHYAFWLDPASVGHNMIRATINDSPPSPEVRIYLPGVAKEWSPQPPEPPPSAEGNPCLVVVGQPFPLQRPPFVAGCAPTSGAPPITGWRQDGTGAYVGFDYVIRNTQGAIVYQASIDIQSSGGRLTSYGGTVSGTGFPDFSQSVTNRYNTSGGLIGADVTKVHDDGYSYQLEITDYCPTASDVSGYAVKVFAPPYNGQEVSLGTCN